VAFKGSEEAERLSHVGVLRMSSSVGDAVVVEETVTVGKLLQPYAHDIGKFQQSRHNCTELFLLNKRLLYCIASITYVSFV
jgi:hypothetical protein